MNSELTNKSETNKEIRIEIPPDQVRKTFDSVSKQYASKVSVPGFRKGLAPLDVVRMRFAEEIKSEVIQQLLPDQVSEAIQEHDLRPLAEPHIHLENAENLKVNGSQPIVVNVHVEVMPLIPEPEYKGLAATRRVRNVDEEEVEGIIDEKRQEQSTFIPVDDRASEDGDMVIVDLKGTFKDEEDADPIEVNDLEVQLGDDLIEKSFTDNLVDVKAGDDKEFEVSYPEDFSSPALAGRTVNYSARVKSVGKVELPELNDEWVASLDDEVKTVKDLKKRIREQMEAMAENDADARIRNDLISRLIEKHEFEVPNALIESQAKNLLDNFARDLAQKGVDLSKVEQSYIEMTYQQMRGQAERDVRGAMLLEKIADIENVEVSEDDVKAEIDQMAAYYQVPVEQVQASLAQQGGTAMLENNLRTRKAVEAIVDQADITKGEWTDEKSAAAEVEPKDEKKSKAKKAKKPEAGKSAGKKAKASSKKAKGKK